MKKLNSTFRINVDKQSSSFKININNSKKKFNFLSKYFYENKNHLFSKIITCKERKKENFWFLNQNKSLDLLYTLNKSHFTTKYTSKYFSSQDDHKSKRISKGINYSNIQNNENNHRINILNNNELSMEEKNINNIKVTEISKKESENYSNTKFLNFQNYNPEIIDKQSNIFNFTEKLPQKLQHFVKLGRYDRPIGYMLLFYPCAWGLTLSTPYLDYHYIYNIFLFLSGSILMRSSGCIINDMWDRNIDKMVERSKMRPLAAGFLTMNEASIFLSVHLALSLLILLKLPLASIIAGLSVMPIVCIYPFMKRITYLPQIFLGICFNSGVVVGFPAFDGLTDLNIVFPIFLGGIFWTLIYDTIYAHMDKLDDAKINVKSTALYFGEKSKFYFYIINLIMITCFYIGLKNYSKKSLDLEKQDSSNNFIKQKKSIINLNSTNVIKNEETENDIKEYNIWNKSPSFLLLFFGFLYQVHLIKSVNLNEPLSCLKTFKKNNLFGIMILAACLSKFYERNSKEEKTN